MDKTTVVAIHGGNMYSSHEDFLERLRSKEVDLERMKPRDDWKDRLQESLGQGFEVLLPRMPTADDAQYGEWKLWYERIMEVLDRPCVLVGHSLGAMFLSKYYSENKPKYAIPGLLLVAGRYNHKGLPSETHTSFTLTGNISVLTKRAKKVVFFHSKDDPIVPHESFEEYKKVVPDADFISFDDRGHFLGPAFPEIVDVILGLEVVK